jgi:hypothetical protein
MNIVSGFISNINTRKDRDITKYLNFGAELMAVEIPMTIFIERSVFDQMDIGSGSGGDFVYRIRGGIMDGIQQKYSYVKVGHITFVFFEMRDLFLWSYRALGHRFQLNTGNPAKDTIEYMMVQCQKSEWMAIASQLSDSLRGGGQVVEYVWVDFGAFHMFGGKIDVFQTELYKLRGRINRRLLQTGGSNRVTFAMCWNPTHVYYGDIYKDINWLFAGSVFGGGGNALQQFALRVREKCLQVLRERNTLMWEINIWVLIYREAPELFALYPSDHSEILFRGYT